MTFATLRLGKTSVEDIRLIDAQESGILTSPMTISVVCTQVPADLLPGTYTFLWLGSDNSKGMPTAWKQGFKALGVVRSIDRGEKYNDESTTVVDISYIFPDAVSRTDILRDAPAAYYWCSMLPVIGLPIESTLQGQDALLSIVMMPPGIPVATVGINAGMNAAVLAVRMLALTDEALAARYAEWCRSLSDKIVKANSELAAIDTYKFKTN